MKTSVRVGSIIIGLAVLATSCNCAFAACPSADLNGDCLVNFLDFQLMASQGNPLDLHTLADQWLEFDDEPPTILGRVEMQTGEPNSFAVEFVIIGKQRIERTVFQYECQVILTNLSATTFANVHLIMTAWPDNMMIIDPHVTFGEAEIGPGETPAAIDTCTFTVDRSLQITPLELIWTYVAAPQDMVFIPGGTFYMGDYFSTDGSPHERPFHSVTLDSFYMGSCELTNQQYCDYLKSALGSSIYVSDDAVYGTENNELYCATSTGDVHSQIAYSGGVFSVRIKNGRDMSNDPMVEVSWYGAAAYCNWRSEQEGKEQCYNLSMWNCDFGKHGYRLATEAEWEYAARGGLSGRRFPWGNTISHSRANYFSYGIGGDPSYDFSRNRRYHPDWNDGVYPFTSPGGSFAANGYGLYDMVGNVREWCNDWYLSLYYISSPTNSPTGPTSGVSRVLRGSAWDSAASSCRVAYRYYGDPADRDDDGGFRIVLDF